MRPRLLLAEELRVGIDLGDDRDRPDAKAWWISPAPGAGRPRPGRRRRRRRSRARRRPRRAAANVTRSRSSRLIRGVGIALVRCRRRPPTRVQRQLAAAPAASSRRAPRSSRRAVGDPQRPLAPPARPLGAGPRPVGLDRDRAGGDVLVAGREEAVHELAGRLAGDRAGVEAAEEDLDERPRDLGREDPLGRLVEAADVERPRVTQRRRSGARRERVVHVDDVEGDRAAAAARACRETSSGKRRRARLRPARHRDPLADADAPAARRRRRPAPPSSRRRRGERTSSRAALDRLARLAHRLAGR